MSEAASVPFTMSDDRGPLQRALEALPHRVAVEAQWELIAAMDEYRTKGDPERFNAAAMSVLLTASLESSSWFHDALSEHECEPIDWAAQTDLDVSTLLS